MNQQQNQIQNETSGNAAVRRRPPIPHHIQQNPENNESTKPGVKTAESSNHSDTESITSSAISLSKANIESLALVSITKIMYIYLSIIETFKKVVMRLVVTIHSKTSKIKII